MDPRWQNRTPSYQLPPQATTVLARSNVSEISVEGNVSSMKKMPAARQFTKRSTSGCRVGRQLPRLFKDKTNCRPCVVEMTKLLSAAVVDIGFAKTNNGSSGEYSA